MTRPKSKQQQQHLNGGDSEPTMPGTSNENASTTTTTTPPSKKARLSKNAIQSEQSQQLQQRRPAVIPNVNREARIGGGDPGYESLITAVSMNPLHPERRMNRFKLTAKRFRYVCNEHVRRSQLRRWTQSYEDARHAYIEAEPHQPSAKSAVHYEAYVNYRLTFMRRHQRVYGQRKIALHRMEKYICEHCACDHLTTLMCHCLNSRNDSVFFFGPMPILRQMHRFVGTFKSNIRCFVRISQLRVSPRDR